MTLSGHWLIDALPSTSASLQRTVNTYLGQHVLDTVVPGVDARGRNRGGVLNGLLSRTDPQDFQHRRRPLLIGGASFHPVAERDHPSPQNLANPPNTVLPFVAPRGTRTAQFLDLTDPTVNVGSFVVGGDQSLAILPSRSHAWAHSDGTGWMHGFTPMRVINHLWHLVAGTVNWVVWDYADFVAQFQQWNGTIWDLLTHTSFLWRSLVTLVLTLGLLELGPLVEGVTRLLTGFWELLTLAFRLTVSVAEEVWMFLALLWEDLVVTPLTWLEQQAIPTETD